MKHNIRYQYPGEGDWDAMLRRRKERLELMENDIEYRLNEVDMKIRLMNGYAGFQKWNRYHLEVYDNEGQTYNIEKDGRFTLQEEE